MKKITLFTLLFSCCLAISYAQPGELDPSFGTNGIVKTDVGVNYNYGGVAKKVLAQPDGSLYVIASGGERPFGTRYPDPNRTIISVIIKKNPDGSNDLSYGDNGFSRFVSMSANSAAMQQDGKIVMVGSRGNFFAIARYNTDGSLDSTFSNDGIQTIRLQDYTIANSVAIHTDGKIVVVGLSAEYSGENTYINSFAIARFNSDGTLDNTFNGDGRLIDDINNSDVPFFSRGAQANSVAIQTDGKIVVVGETLDGAAVVVRYNTDGSRDNDFIENDYVVQHYGRANSVVIQSDGTIVVGGDGLHWYNSDGDLVASQSIGGIAESIALQTDGKIVVAGYTNTGSTIDSTDFLTARFNTDGSPDNTFSGDGKQTTDFGEGYNIAFSIAIQNDGKIVTAGFARKGSNNDFALARYESNGDPDNSFDRDGKLTGRILAANAIYTSTAVQKDGKVVAAGKAWNGSNFDFAIARYNIDGTLDNTFSSDGKQTTDFNSQNDFTNSIAIQSDGKIVIGGSAIVRYNTDGSLDNTFSGDGIQPNNHYIASLAIQGDGKIVVAGNSEGDEGRSFTLSRYNSDGSLDNTFGENGTVSLEYFNYSYATSLAIQRDGKIVAVGGINGYSNMESSSDYIITRFNTDGSLDDTFGEGGMLTSYGEFSSNSVANAIAIQSDGTIVVVFNSTQLSESDNRGVSLVSYDTNGVRIKNLETGFGTGTNVDDHATSVVLQSDDKIVVGGRSANNFALARFNKDLSLDSSFSGDGKQITEAILSINGISDIAIANNKLYAVGSSTSSGTYGVVARYLLTNDGQNNAPTVTLTIPYNIVKYSAPARIKLNAAATDKDGKITKVQFFNGTTRLHTEDVSPYGFLWINVPAGNYTLTAKAFDDSGNVVTSNVIEVSVVNENVPPVVSIVSPVDNATYTGPATIRLIAEAKDPNDKISKVEFYNGAALLRTEYYYPYNYTWTNVQPGTYTITAVAYDDKGLSTTSEPITITVNASSLPIVKSRPSVNNQSDVNGVLSMKLSPVPAGSTLQISTQGLRLNKPSTISVISASGVVVKTIQSNTSNTVVQLDVSSLVSGVYTIKVTSEEKIMYKQFLKL